MTGSDRTLGLVLTGGGARAAYQVGVLRAVAELVRRGAPTPFPVLCGTSAGAINAACVAAHADDFRRAVHRLVAVWRSLDFPRVYRADPLGMTANGARWLGALLIGRFGRRSPTSLLDNEPLRRTLLERIPFERIAGHLAAGHLRAVSVNATAYATGEAVSFFEGEAGLEGWRRARRTGTPVRLSADHLMASAAIPVLFPAVRLGAGYFGDGSMRQIAPLSPALHLGADRVLVVAVGRSMRAHRSDPKGDYPSLAQIAGHALSSIFFDNLEVDLERVAKINRLVESLADSSAGGPAFGLRRVEVLRIQPSEDIETIASRFRRRLPRTVSLFLGGLGATRRNGSNLLSYLLFDPGFCRALIDLGYRDAMDQREALEAFIGAPAMAPVRARRPDREDTAHGAPAVAPRAIGGGREEPVAA